MVRKGNQNTRKITSIYSKINDLTGPEQQSPVYQQGFERVR